MSRRPPSSPHIIALSSFVAHGGVGLRAVMAAAFASGARVTALPSVVLSSHLGYPAVARQAVEVSALDGTLQALVSNGAMADVDGCLIGYLPSPAHVAFAGRMIDAVKAANPNCAVLVDPVIGDDPDGLYVDPTIAAAITFDLIRRADVLTPNRFELSHFSGDVVRDTAGAVAAARKLMLGGVRRVVCTSVPAGPQHLSNVSVGADDVRRMTVTKAIGAPHGTGDLFAAALLLALLDGDDDGGSLARATAMVRHVLSQSIGRLELALEKLDLDSIRRQSMTAEVLA